MRHIVLDTETTGFEAEGADRIVEIGALELVNYVPTGRVFHQYINPERDIPENVVAVHGITNDRVANEPIFSQIAESFRDFLGNDPLVIHNAEFDMRFINAEFKRVGFPALPMTRAQCTLIMARKLFPGAPNSLDALCKRYNIDNSSRTYHGALLDSQLLAEIFLELAGGRQPELLGGGKTAKLLDETIDEDTMGVLWPARDFPLTEGEQAAHAKMIEGIKDALWLKDA
jgi:DNA polymerase III subunit epsilon